MNLKRPYTYNFEESRGLLNQLEEITQAILQFSTGENLPRFNQLILERERLIEACHHFELSAFNEEQKTCLKAQLERCQTLDQAVLENMQTFKTKLGDQLRQVKQSQKLLSKYQVPTSNDSETHNENA